MLDTLQNVKDRLGITTSDDDAFLANQIQVISDVIEAYCRRKFSASNWIETFYCDGYHYSKFLELYHFPTIALTEITIDGSIVPLSDTRVHKGTSWVKRTDGGWLSGKEIQVKYRAGFETIPSPILSVLDSLVLERYNRKKAGVDLDFGANVQRISIPGAISIDFDYTLSNNERSSAYGTIIGNYANVLDDWRSERAVLGSNKLEYVEEAP